MRAQRPQGTDNFTAHNRSTATATAAPAPAPAAAALAAPLSQQHHQAVAESMQQAVAVAKALADAVEASECRSVDRQASVSPTIHAVGPSPFPASPSVQEMEAAAAELADWALESEAEPEPAESGRDASSSPSSPSTARELATEMAKCNAEFAAYERRRLQLTITGEKQEQLVDPELETKEQSLNEDLLIAISAVASDMPTDEGTAGPGKINTAQGDSSSSPVIKFEGRAEAVPNNNHPLSPAETAMIESISAATMSAAAEEAIIFSDQNAARARSAGKIGRM